MSDDLLIQHYDDWLKEPGPAAVVMREWLVPVEGRDAVIFPPTYPAPQGQTDFPVPYNLDFFPDGTSVCQIDSVGSQANRMESVFKRKPYDELAPQVVVKAGSREVNLLDAGHRAADAIVRFSTLQPEFDRAFRAFLESGNAEPMAQIAPTSLVFGAWDSRATQAKLPRVVRSVIRAYGVRKLHRSAVYIPPVDYVAEGLLGPAEDKAQQDARSELGLSHAPATWTHGGVVVEGTIRRDGALSLTAIRTLAGSSETRTLALRRYVLALGLVALTAPGEVYLRQGCELVSDPEHPAEWELVYTDGRREAVSLPHDQALAYAREAAAGFGVGQARRGEFQAEKALEALGLTKQQRKATRRAGQVKLDE